MSVREALKQVRRRLGLWLLAGALLTLVDEYLKEGYVFKPSDLLVPFTHEQFFTLLLIGSAAVILINWLRREREKVT